MADTSSPKAPSKKHMVTLWVAIATALGSQGIPKIIEILDTKPTVEQVQSIVAKQLEALSHEQPMTVEAIKELYARMLVIEARVSETCGKVDVMRDVLSKCCTRRNAVRRLTEPRKPGAAKPFSAPAAMVKAKSFIGKLKKVPEFNIQQQLQLPLQEEPDK